VYFDPFGISPAPEVEAFMKRFHIPIYVSRAELQNITSSDCGAWCIYVYLHLQHESLSDVLSHFSRDTTMNDRRVEQWARTWLHL
jgi:hypothetical protein